MYWQRPLSTSIRKPLFPGTWNCEPGAWTRTSLSPSIVTRHVPSTISMSSVASVLKWKDPGRIMPRVFLTPSGSSIVWLMTPPSKYTLALVTMDTPLNWVAIAGTCRILACFVGAPPGAPSSGNLEAAPHHEALLVLHDIAVCIEDVLPAAGRSVILARNLRQGVALGDHVRPCRGRRGRGHHVGRRRAHRKSLSGTHGRRPGGTRAGRLECEAGPKLGVLDGEPAGLVLGMPELRAQRIDLRQIGR